MDGSMAVTVKCVKNEQPCTELHSVRISDKCYKNIVFWDYFIHTMHLFKTSPIQEGLKFEITQILLKIIGAYK